jgi:hypothetical protein
MEEEKESHFIAGKNCVNNLDYTGAVEEFEKALRANPDSASAHFQLGWLCEEKEPDPAVAIYHYQQFLKLRPNADNTEFIKQRINNCKQDLAKTVLNLPITPGMQHELEKLVEENKRYRDELEKWRAAAGHLPIPTNPPAGAEATAARSWQTPAPAPLPPTNSGQPGSAADRRQPAIPGAARTYVVKTGDTPFSIAKKNNVRLDTLLASNPGLDPKRLKIGQTLNLPPP